MTVWKEPPSDYQPQVEAVVCIFTHNDHHLILRYAENRQEKGLWVNPCGKLEPGEPL